MVNTIDYRGMGLSRGMLSFKHNGNKDVFPSSSLNSNSVAVFILLQMVGLRLHFHLLHLIPHHLLYHHSHLCPIKSWDQMAKANTNAPPNFKWGQTPLKAISNVAKILLRSSIFPQPNHTAFHKSVTPFVYLWLTSIDEKVTNQGRKLIYELVVFLHTLCRISDNISHQKIFQS